MYRTTMTTAQPPEIRFDNRFVEKLPGDPNLNNTRRQVEQACYSKVIPKKAIAPELVAFSKEAAGLLDFSQAFCTSQDFLQIFSGNMLLPGMEPYAMCYGGHQFGSWAGQLGDGRAINLGELVNAKKERWILQLKGAGATPYSRNADGLAVLRSSIREFLCSEAMYHLNVPTTRALSLVLTGEQVERDMFYDGHPKMEPGAVVCRLASSFTRFGNFEIFAARNQVDVLKQLVDYTIETDFPHLGRSSPSVIIKWFRQVCRTTAQMVAHWMRVGFVHGVMNTDNMSILGQTIDYGPYGWLEDYNPSWTPNTTDAATRRYSFGNQPGIAQWNLLRLANAIYPVIGRAEPLSEAIEYFGDTYLETYNGMMAGKIGLRTYEASTDKKLISQLLELLSKAETDYTLFFRNLARVNPVASPEKPVDIKVVKQILEPAYYQPEQITPEYDDQLEKWIIAWAYRIKKDGRSFKDIQAGMNRCNPKYVLRNYLAQQAIEKAQEESDFSMVHDLLEVMRHPYDEQQRKERFAKKRPEWARSKPGCSMLSCSS